MSKKRDKHARDQANEYARDQLQAPVHWSLESSKSISVSIHILEVRTEKIETHWKMKKADTNKKIKKKISNEIKSYGDEEIFYVLVHVIINQQGNNMELCHAVVVAYRIFRVGRKTRWRLHLG